MSQEFRAGFACLVGRPNAGKSSLTNSLFGQTVSIISCFPQITPHTFLVIPFFITSPLLFLDSPGLPQPPPFLALLLFYLLP